MQYLARIILLLACVTAFCQAYLREDHLLFSKEGKRIASQKKILYSLTIHILTGKSENPTSSVACCDQSCKTAICVPPWVSICSGCKHRSMEKVLINQQDQDEGAPSSVSELEGKADPSKKDCCDNKCKQPLSSPPL